ncbi:flagellar basal body P-ring protein FlgI [bacterium]|nr:flagellar basal body P-ring protein FlgI [bacterium]
MSRIKNIIWLLLVSSFVFAQVRIKDIASVESGNRRSLVGYGLVVGLNGSGDRASRNQGAVFTIQSIANMLERFGITVSKDNLRTRNVAAVMVTCSTPSYGRVGSHFDATVSSLGDAGSLEGGILLMTPLFAQDGKQYASVQGPVSVGGYNIETMAGESIRKNHAMVGRVPNGATLESVSDAPVFNLDEPLRYLLTEPDFVTASRVAEAINNHISLTTIIDNMDIPAKPLDAATVEISFPDTIQTQEDAVFFIAAIETLMVIPDIEARVVINERTGTIVAGGAVRVSEVMISHGALSIHVKRAPIISQPVASFSNAGQTVVDYITETTVKESIGKSAVISKTTTVNDLAAGLNELGLRPRDVIAIFQAIKQAGALNAKLIII